MAAERPVHPRLGRFQFALGPRLARSVAGCTFVTLAIPGILLIEGAFEGMPDWPWTLKVMAVPILIIGLPTWWVFFRLIRYRVEIYELGLRDCRYKTRELLYDDAVGFLKVVIELHALIRRTLKCTIMKRDAERFDFDNKMVGFDGFCVRVERELARRGIEVATEILFPWGLEE